MDLHPLVVHFPIALLMCYAVLEVLRLPIITGQAWYFHAKALPLIVGTLFSFLSLSTGEMAERSIDRSLRVLLELHQTFASLSVFFFTVLAVVYALLWLDRELSPSFLRWRFLHRMLTFCSQTWFLVLFSVAGALALSVTGGFGGMLVHGAKTDPFFAMFYDVLVTWFGL